MYIYGTDPRLIETATLIKAGKDAGWLTDTFGSLLIGFHTDTMKTGIALVFNRLDGQLNIYIDGKYKTYFDPSWTIGDFPTPDVVYDVLDLDPVEG